MGTDSTTAAATESKKPMSTTTCQSRSTEIIDDTEKGLHVTIERGYAADTDWYQKIINNTKWYRVKYKSNRFGKECETPCWTTFFGGVPDYQPYQPVPQWLQPLVDQVSQHLQTPFNAMLLRLYWDGKDEIAWHTDGRTFLGPTPVIASLSFGATASFQMRRMTTVWPTQRDAHGGVDRTTPQRDFVIQHGDMLVMRHVTQQYWHHRVPSTKGRTQPRVNINFRYIVPGLDAERGQQTYYKYMVHGDASQPPSFTFDDIMAQRGGLRNFFRPVEAGQGKANDKEKVNFAKRSDDAVLGKQESNKNVHKTNHSKRSAVATGEKVCSFEQECAKYLESEDTVDKETFFSLPLEIRKEIIADWKLQRLGKRPAGAKITAKKKAKGNTRTIHSFFEKK